MQDILTCAMGLDVHRDTIVACLVKGAVDAEPEAETRTFSIDGCNNKTKVLKRVCFGMRNFRNFRNRILFCRT